MPWPHLCSLPDIMLTEIFRRVMPFVAADFVRVAVIIFIPAPSGSYRFYRVIGSRKVIAKSTSNLTWLIDLSLTISATLVFWSSG